METTLTLKQLRNAAKDQILTAINARLNTMTKAQLVGLILTVPGDAGNKIELVDNAVNTFYPDKQVKSRLEVRRDALGVKIGSRRTDWTYYPTGEVDTITVMELDANDAVVKRRVLEHYIDGRQPKAVEA